MGTLELEKGLKRLVSGVKMWPEKRGLEGQHIPISPSISTPPPPGETGCLLIYMLIFISMVQYEYWIRKYVNVAIFNFWFSVAQKIDL